MKDSRKIAERITKKLASALEDARLLEERELRVAELETRLQLVELALQTETRAKEQAEALAKKAREQAAELQAILEVVARIAREQADRDMALLNAGLQIETQAK